MTTQTPLRAGFPLFLMSMTVLWWEILLTRIYSAILFYHFAFLAVSVAIFGLTLGSMLIFLVRPREDAELGSTLATLAALTAVTLVLSITAQLFIPSHTHNPLTFYAFLIRTYIFSTMPFIPAGAFITLFLTRYASVGTVYAYDLIGAGVACALLPALMQWLGAPTVALLAAVVALWAGYLLSRHVSSRRRLIFGGLLAATAVLMAGNVQAHWLRLRWGPGGLLPTPLYEKWNAFSRISVVDFRRCVFVWDADPRAVAGAVPIDVHMLDIDWGVGTPVMRFDGNLSGLSYLRRDMTCVAQYVRPSGAMLIIGPGGGRDILTALQFSHSRIDAVEVNRNILTAVNQVFGDFTGHLDRYPTVHFIVDEGRNYIEKNTARYDLIQASLVDAGAAAAAGTYAFMENGLYTVEAWRHILRRLTPNGVFAFSRWYYGAAEWPVETYRLINLAATALRAEGISNVAQHVLVVHSARVQRHEEGLVTLLVSAQAFSPADIQHLSDACKVIHCTVAFSANGSLDPAYQQLLSDDPSVRERLRVPLDITAPTDNRPYFFFFIRFKDLWERTTMTFNGASSWNTPTIKVLAGLTIVSVFFAVILLLAPVLFSKRTVTDLLALPGGLRIPLYFALIGLGYMFVEIALIQRLGLFLGHPTYGFTVTLLSLLLASGLGSFAWQLSTDRGAWWPGRLLLAAITISIIAMEGASRALLVHSLGVAMPWRIVFAALVVLPSAFLMGACFPTGMKAIRLWPQEMRAWCWGINGAFSVLGSVLAMVVSFGGGIQMTFWMGAVCYLLLTVVFPKTAVIER